MYNWSYKRCCSIGTLSHVLVITYAGLVSKSITHGTVSQRGTYILHAIHRGEHFNQVTTNSTITWCWAKGGKLESRAIPAEVSPLQVQQRHQWVETLIQSFVNVRTWAIALSWCTYWAPPFIQGEKKFTLKKDLHVKLMISRLCLRICIESCHASDTATYPWTSTAKGLLYNFQGL